MNKARSGASNSNYLVPILGSALKILDVFYEAESDLTLHEISAKANVGKTSAFRILYTLDKFGYVEKDHASGKYHLGFGIISAARKTLASRNLVQVAGPISNNYAMSSMKQLTWQRCSRMKLFILKFSRVHTLSA